MTSSGQPLVLIAGGGIGGLATALTLNQIGVACKVFESASAMRPLGVGLNLQPNAVRELLDMDISIADLDGIGVQAKEWALVGLTGKEVYAEARGLDAGYNWPQYAAHRGEFHMMLYRHVQERLGPDAVELGARVVGFTQDADGVTLHVKNGDNTVARHRGSLLLGADGIHSSVRAQMVPDQPPIQWGGAIMWRGTVRDEPKRTASSFIGLGTHRHRMVMYPISPVGADGKALINWIAEVTVDNADGWQHDGWFRPVEIDHFIEHFEEFRYDWLDVPEMLRRADCSYENPMIDRDPIPTWVDKRVALMGDAAHPMYPTGSNGASQAIVDARVLGAKFIEHGVNPDGLAAYNAQLCEPVNEVVLRNRGAGPFALLDMLHDRCGGTFDNIDDVISADERTEFMAKYQVAAGFAKDRLNSAPPTIAAGATVE